MLLQVQSAMPCQHGREPDLIQRRGSSQCRMQGRAACEIDTADELLATELLMNGEFSSLDEHMLAALASTLVPQEQTQVRSAIPAAMQCEAATLG